MFAELSYFLMPISFADTETFYQSCIQVWCHDFSLFVFGESKEKAFNGNWEQIYRAFVHFAYLKTYPLGLWYVNRLNAFEWVLNTPWTLVSVCGCLWVIVNSPWTPIECTWMPMSECEHPLNTHWVCMNVIGSFLNATHRGVTMRKTAFLWELNSPWMRLSAHEHLWLSIEHPLDAIECAWTLLSEYWICPECHWIHVNAFEECEQPLNTHWVHMNAFE